MDGQIQIADRNRWAQRQFGEVDLGDVRRTRRLVKGGFFTSPKREQGFLPERLWFLACVSGWSMVVRALCS